MARIVLAAITAVALAGCANSEATKRAAAQAAFQAEIKAAGAECQSYGAKPDSDANGMDRPCSRPEPLRG